MLSVRWLKFLGAVIWLLAAYPCLEGFSECKPSHTVQHFPALPNLPSCWLRLYMFVSSLIFDHFASEIDGIKFLDRNALWLDLGVKLFFFAAVWQVRFLHACFNVASKHLASDDLPHMQTWRGHNGCSHPSAGRQQPSGQGGTHAWPTKIRASPARPLHHGLLHSEHLRTVPKRIPQDGVGREPP